MMTPIGTMLPPGQNCYLISLDDDDDEEGDGGGSGGNERENIEVFGKVAFVSDIASGTMQFMVHNLRSY